MNGPPASPRGVEDLLAAERAGVEQALRRALDGVLPQLGPGLRGPVEAGVLAGGKRLRPVLCVTAYRASAGEGDAPARAGARRRADDALYDLAVSLELVHAYSLMHDDLPCMDDADLRRGRPTPHTLYGEAATVVGAAALIPAAGLQAWRAAGALGMDVERRRELVRVLAVAAGSAGMVGGQGLDLLGEGKALSREELDGLHRRKTGALLTAALVMGAVAAGAPSSVRSALLRYGREVGLAFQIADDVLDATADAAALGKNPSDRELEKSTYPRLLGIEAARAEAERRVAAATGALEEAGLDSPELRMLAAYVIERDR